MRSHSDEFEVHSEVLQSSISRVVNQCVAVMKPI